MASLGDLYNHLKTLTEQWYYNKSQMDTSLGGKVDKETGKGLSTNDYTTAEKNKLSGIEAQANKTIVDSALSSTSTNPLQNKAINTALSSKADSSDIPTKTSDLTNDGADGTNVFVANNDSRLTDSRTPTSHTHGNLGNDGKVVLSGNQVVKNKLIGANNTGELIGVEMRTSKLTNDGADGTNVFVANNDSRLSDSRTPTNHNQATSTITNSTAFDHIKSGESTTLTLDTQAKINDAINTKLGTLMEADIVVVTNNKGTASASTMNKLYLEAKSGGASGDGYNIWITVRTGTSPNYSYAWEKVDDFDLQTLSVAWANVTGKPASAFGTTSGTFAEGNHTHNYLTNDGKITQTITNNGNLVVTNSSNQVGVQSAIDVLDGVVNQLISYGSS